MFLAPLQGDLPVPLSAENVPWVGHAPLSHPVLEVAERAPSLNRVEQRAAGGLILHTQGEVPHHLPLVDLEPVGQGHKPAAVIGVDKTGLLDALLLPVGAVRRVVAVLGGAEFLVRQHHRFAGLTVKEGVRLVALHLQGFQDG